MHRLLRPTYLAACAALLAACASPVAVPPEVTLINAARMNQLIEVAPPRMSDTETGTRRAQLALHNRTTARVMIEGRARFGNEAPGGWQQAFLEPQSDASLQFLSLSSAGREVHIELREGNR